MIRWIIAACFFLLAALAFSPVPSPAGPGESERLYFLGREAITAEDAQGAIRLLEKAIAEDPNHLEARYHLGILYSGNINTYEKAEQEFLELPSIAIRSGVKSRDDLLFRTGLALGNLYVKSGKNTRAAQLIKNVIFSAPPNVPLDKAYNSLGLSLYYDRIYDDAIFELRKAIKLNPNNMEARFNLKTIRARLEHFQAGKIYSRMGDRKEATAEFRKAIEIDPRFIEARQRLGVELHLAGQHAEGLKELRRADSISAGYQRAYEIWYAQGRILTAMGKTEEALQQFNRVVEARPKFAAAHNETGKIHLNRGNGDAAIDCFARAIALDPKAEYTQNLLLAVTRKGEHAGQKK